MNGRTASPIPAPGMETGPRLVTALFRNQDEAEDAVTTLLGQGVAKDAIRLVPGYERDRPDGAEAPARPLDSGVGSGLTAVVDGFFRAESAPGYDRGEPNRGGCLVSVHTTDADRERIVGVLGQNGTIDEDEPDIA